MARKPTAAGAAAVTDAPMTRGELIDALEANRQARRDLEILLKPYEDEYKILKSKIIELLLADKEEKAGTSNATVSISRVKVPVFDDIEAAIKFVARTKNYQVFLGQPFSTPAWRELVASKGCDVPGTHTFEKVDLNHTSIKS